MAGVSEVVAQAMRYAGCPNRRSLGFKRSVPPSRQGLLARSSLHESASDLQATGGAPLGSGHIKSREANKRARGKRAVAERYIGYCLVL